ncbi:TerC family protein [Pelagibacterium luteolum]|uniref:Tellurite resistance protein TerC n=1 Tax=Pelagibacterium luteolum TaxID=440168 RepID=A0A1G7WAS4_9HYPH|nr:TerC family protein [Pelagibacterium luteolum]SDG69113.1 tellurite resistance protein TerC [Pelagibacterium luteolum]
MDFAFLYTSFLDTPVWFWLAFLGVVTAVLVFDLGFLHKEQKEISAKESFVLYGMYVLIACAFGAWVWFVRGSQAGLEFFTGYIIEQSLAMDNIFVIASIFAFLGVPRLYQYRVLFWGIIGVLVFRAILIGAGVALVHAFEPILFLFGAFLVFTGIRMFSKIEEDEDIENNKILKFLRKRFRITPQFHGNKFLVEQPHPKTGKMVLWLTPLAVALIMVEIVDVIFAVDSVPAIFAITTDPFIVYTSNVFAVLGLRALFFALSAAMARFRYLQTALAIVLVYVGVKVFMVPLGIHIPTLLSLFITIGTLSAGIAYSLWRTRNDPPLEQQIDPVKPEELKSTDAPNP